MSRTFVRFVTEKSYLSSGFFTENQCRQMVYTGPQVCCPSERTVRLCNPAFWGHRVVDCRL